MSLFRSKLRLSLLIPAVLAISPLAASAASYFNGFENAGDELAFTNNANGIPGSNITRVASNTPGTLGYTASSGGFYAEIKNTPDAYQPGFGDSTYTTYGTGVATSPGGFSESVDYYVDIAKWLPISPGYASGFEIDSTPSTDPLYIDELNFRINVPTAGTVNIDTGTIANGDTPLTTISASGWYTFTMTFTPGANGFVTNTMSVSDHGTVLGSFSNQSTLPNASLTGTNYGDWTTVWGNGFAGDTLAIDNVTVSPVPLPKSAWMGLALLVGFGVTQKRRSARAV